LTCCTQGCQPLLASQHIHDAFLQFCHAASTRNIFVGRYVLMPITCHLFVKFSDPAQDLSAWVKILKNSLFQNPPSVGPPGTPLAKGIL